MILFCCRKRRTARFGEYNGKPVEVLLERADGTRLIACGQQRFTAYPDELLALAKPLHGSPQNWVFNEDWTPRGITFERLSEIAK
jgi:hypothetical protein